MVDRVQRTSTRPAVRIIFIIFITIIVTAVDVYIIMIL